MLIVGQSEKIKHVQDSLNKYFINLQQRKSFYFYIVGFRK